MPNRIPRIIIAALKGGSGKTIVSLGLAASWRDRGFKIAPFKKGPDFIDSSWLSLATGHPCYNLDSFLMTEPQIVQSFLTNSAENDISLIEGNRGLFDGLDQEDGFLGIVRLEELPRLAPPDESVEETHWAQIKALYR